MKKLLLLLFLPLLFSCNQSSNKSNPLEENIKHRENTETTEKSENTLNLDLDVTIINKSGKGINIPTPNIQKPKPNIQKPKPNIQKPKPNIQKPKPNIQKPKPKPKPKPKNN